MLVKAPNSLSIILSFARTYATWIYNFSSCLVAIKSISQLSNVPTQTSYPKATNSL